MYKPTLTVQGGANNTRDVDIHQSTYKGCVGHVEGCEFDSKGSKAQSIAEKRGNNYEAAS